MEIATPLWSDRIREQSCCLCKGGVKECCDASRQSKSNQALHYVLVPSVLVLPVDTIQRHPHAVLSDFNHEHREAET